MIKRFLQKVMTDSDKAYFIQDLITLIKQENYLTLQKVMISERFEDYDIFHSLFSAGSEDLVSEACNVGNIRILQLLIDYGANVNAIHNKGYSPLTIAIKKKNVKYKDNPDLAILNQEKYIKIIVTLLENGAKVNIPDKNKLFPLNIACALGDFEIAALLLDHGSSMTDSIYIRLHDVTIHATPLECAVVSGNLQLVKYLWDKMRSNPPLKKYLLDKHNNILELAISLNKNDIVEFFVSEKNLNIDNLYEFEKAMQISNIDAIKILLKNEAPLNQFAEKLSDSEIRMSLIFKLIRDNIPNIEKSIKFLSRIGANINDVTDDSSQSFDFDNLESAFYNRNFNLVKTLLENGVIIKPYFTYQKIYQRYDSSFQNIIWASIAADRLLENCTINEREYSYINDHIEIVKNRIISIFADKNFEGFDEFMSKLLTNELFGKDHELFTLINNIFENSCTIFRTIENYIAESDISYRKFEDPVFENKMEYFFKIQDVLVSYLSNEKFFVTISNLDFTDQLVFLREIKKLINDESLLVPKKLLFNLVIRLERDIEEVEKFAQDHLSEEDSDDESSTDSVAKDFHTEIRLALDLDEEYLLRAKSDSISQGRESETHDAHNFIAGRVDDHSES